MEFVRALVMQRNVSPQQLADGYHLSALRSEEREHLQRTYRSLTRSQKRGTPNPRYLERFAGNFWAFQEWSLQNGFALGSELVLENPRIVPDTMLRYRWLRAWDEDGRLGFEHEMEPVHRDPDERVPSDEWITDYDVRWVPIRELVRANPLPLMPRYNRLRVRALRRAMHGELKEEERAAKELKARRSRRGKRQRLIKAWAEMKSAAAWAKDSRAAVSDKIISRRIEAGWREEDAICTPQGRPGPKPRK